MPPPPAHAGLPGVVIGTARTIADGVRDGLHAPGDTTKDFVAHGRDAAADTWDRSVDRVREHARANTDHLWSEAGLGEESPEPYRSDEPLDDDSSDWSGDRDVPY